MTKITGFDTFDVRFPTSRTLAGSDAMNPAPDYSAAYVVIRTDAADPALSGHGFAFTIGRGNDVQLAAIRLLEPFLAGQDLDEVLADLGGLGLCEIGQHPSMFDFPPPAGPTPGPPPERVDHPPPPPPAVTAAMVGARSADEITADTSYLSTPIPDGLWAELDALLHDREGSLVCPCSVGKPGMVTTAARWPVARGSAARARDRAP